VHFVLNVPHNLNIDVLENEIDQIAQIVSNNKIDVKIEYHIGQICDSFKKLKDEYFRLSGISDGEKDMDTSRNDSKNKCIYRVSENNAIINSILEGDYENAIATIDRILITNVVNNVSSEDAKMLYYSIINTRINAFKMKKINVDNLINDMNDDTYFNISAKSETEISKFILDLVELVGKTENEGTEENRMYEIMKYIEENYKNYELTLEYVARHFNVDSKALSKHIKKYSNITFRKYLTELRIEEAKRLMITTDMSIEQIYIEVGYVSRTTFIRAFDSVEKITPSEYRKKVRG
jgi:AraC-like DNA-binding protein